MYIELELTINMIIIGNKVMTENETSQATFFVLIKTKIKKGVKTIAAIIEAYKTIAEIK
ncbi:MAG: hypothetical protein WCZ90_03785 [Melioribacteraceae bacterium]